jgi:YD repeat-containing protein
VQTYNYSDPMARLSNLMVGTPGGGYGNLFNRSYQYDNAGNVYSIVNNQNAEQQTYAYDPLDRLTNWDTNTSVHEQYVYDAIGNLTSKAGTAYIYGATNNGPHQAKTVGGQTYNYDSNGNLASGGNRNYTWNAENQPTL